MQLQTASTEALDISSFDYEVMLCYLEGGKSEGKDLNELRRGTRLFKLQSKLGAGF